MNKISRDEGIKSGLSSGIELESIVLGILGDAEEILEEELLDLLMQVNELKPLRTKFAKYAQKLSETQKEHRYRNQHSEDPVRGEIAILLKDITDGNWHGTVGFSAHRKLSIWIVNFEQSHYRVVRRANDVSWIIKKQF